MIDKMVNKIDNWKYKGALFISLSILIKLVYLFVIALYFDDSKNGHLYNDIQGDNVIYQSFCENIFQIGEYVTKTGESFDYTFRMPGMAFLYVPIRLFTDSETAVDVFLIIQTIFSGLAAYYLAVLAANILKKRKLFYLVYFISCFGFLIPLYNNMFMTESLALSSMIMGCYFLYKAEIEKKNKFYFISGVFFTWLLFLRPFMLVFYIVILAYLLFCVVKKRINFKVLIFFGCTFFVLDGLWTVRNYIKIHQFMPLQSSSSWASSYPEAFQLRLKFQQDFGFRGEPWVFESQSGWFDDTINGVDRKYISKIFPKRTFNGDLTIDSLILVRQLLQNSLSVKNSIQEKDISNKKAVRLFNKFIFELNKERPLDYYLMNRARIVNNFLCENLFFALVPLKYPYNVIGVLVDSFSNYFLKSIGLIGLLLIFIKYKKNHFILILITFVPIFIMAYFPIYSRLDESRFFVMAAPFLMICAGYLVSLMLESSRFRLVKLFFLFLIPAYFSFEILLDKINF